MKERKKEIEKLYMWKKQKKETKNEGKEKTRKIYWNN